MIFTVYFLSEVLHNNKITFLALLLMKSGLESNLNNKHSLSIWILYWWTMVKFNANFKIWQFIHFDGFSGFSDHWLVRKGSDVQQRAPGQDCVEIGNLCVLGNCCTSSAGIRYLYLGSTLIKCLVFIAKNSQQCSSEVQTCLEKRMFFFLIDWC